MRSVIIVILLFCLNRCAVPMCLYCSPIVKAGISWKSTIENFIERSARLYEREPEGSVSSPRLGLYVKRWCRWVHAGFDRSVPYGRCQLWHLDIISEAGSRQGSLLGAVCLSSSALDTKRLNTIRQTVVTSRHTIRRGGRGRLFLCQAGSKPEA